MLFKHLFVKSSFCSTFSVTNFTSKMANRCSASASISSHGSKTTHPMKGSQVGGRCSDVYSTLYQLCRTTPASCTFGGRPERSAKTKTDSDQHCSIRFCLFDDAHFRRNHSRQIG